MKTSTQNLSHALPVFNTWSVVVFKHGKFAILESDIESSILGLSAVKRHKNDPKFAGCYIRSVKTEVVNNLFDRLTVEEFLNQR